MKIAAYDVKSASQRLFTSAAHITTTAKLTTSAKPREEQSANVSISDQARKALAQAKSFNENKTLAAAMLKYDGRSKPTNPGELKLNILLRFIEQITGKKFNFPAVEPDMQTSMPPVKIGVIEQSARTAQAQTLTVEQTSMYHEYESVSFSSTGTVLTEDGQQISFDVSLSMSREYAEYSSISASLTKEMKMCDPLIINYGAGAATLTETKFSFDLLANGEKRDISFAGAGSGFLALDKNGDGTINDGSELFGPQSGDGFADLRAYDSDGNGWIDESDAIYTKLTVWTKDENGNDVFLSLKEADVGAIFLGNVQTEFTLGNSMNANGVIRSTGVFLKDSGGAGTVQHVDLKI